MNETNGNDQSVAKEVEKDADNTKTSQLKCLMNLLKGNMGSGVLALPLAFRYAGLWVGVTGNLLLGYVALHSMHMLVNFHDDITKRGNYNALGYAEVAEACVAAGPKCIQKYDKLASKLINTVIMILLLGTCSLYIIFVAENLRQIINSSDAPDPSLDKIIITCEIGATILFCTVVQSLNELAYLSMLANILQIIGLAIIMYNICTELPAIDTRPAVGSIDTISLYFGIGVYAFQGVIFVIPMKNKVQDEHDYGRRFGLLTLAVTMVIALYTAIGFFGYLKYGNDVHGSISLNIPATGWLWKSTKLMLVFGIFISYGVQFYVLMSITWPPIESRLESETSKFWLNIAIRIGLNVFTCIISIIVPHIGPMTGLVGALSVSCLQYIFPPLLQLITLSAEGQTLPYSIVIKDLLIFSMGLAGMLMGSYASIKSIAELF